MRVLIILAILATSQIAEAGLFDILNEKYIEDISELPYSPGNPQMDWQESGNIRAWLDIVGFRNLSRNGEKYYILGDPASLAIVQYDAQGIQSGTLDSITKDVSFSQSGNNLIAVMNVKLKWHKRKCNKDQCWNVYRNDEATFQDIKEIPEQFNKVLNPKVSITEFNNTIEPKISIQVINTNGSKISISYGDKSLTHSSKSYHVEQTDKGVYFANVSNLEAWDIQGQGIAHFGDSIIINGNISSFDYSKLDIKISNLYASAKVDPSEFNITRVTYQPETVFYNPVLYGFLGIFLTLTGSAFYLIRQVTL